MIHGVINIDKEKGYTSHDVVARLRGIVGQKKIGHTGTLDPDATGVLPVCLGKATKLCDMLTDKNKTYEATLLLGTTTDTQDTSGIILQQCKTDDLSVTEVEKVITGFVGSYEQIPPMYSALKVNGRKLYELAREGKVIDRKSRTVYIHEIKITNIELPRVQIVVSCSKGTYIRTLCHDIGTLLNCGGCMEELRRTKVGTFLISESITLAEVERLKKEGLLSQAITPIDALFQEYKKIKVANTGTSLLYNGNPFSQNHIRDKEHFDQDELVRVYDEQDNFIAVYSYQQIDKGFKIVKMFYDHNEMI